MDRVTTEQRRRNMQHIRCKDTSPELTVRRLVCELGFRSRYRLYRHELPGRPDLVFPRFRKIIFVHGCFWHCHVGCPSFHIPSSRRDYWAPKLRRNSLRDKVSLAQLKRDGWKVLVLWECQLGNRHMITRRISKFLGKKPTTTTSAYRAVRLNPCPPFPAGNS